MHLLRRLRSPAERRGKWRIPAGVSGLLPGSRGRGDASPPGGRCTAHPRRGPAVAPASGLAPGASTRVGGRGAGRRDRTRSRRGAGALQRAAASPRVSPARPGFPQTWGVGGKTRRGTGRGKRHEPDVPARETRRRPRHHCPRPARQRSDRTRRRKRGGARAEEGLGVGLKISLCV